MLPTPSAAGTPRRRLRDALRVDAIACGAVIGVAGVPLGYVVLMVARVTISDGLLLVCLAAPTLLLLLVSLIKPARAWAFQAAAASALASIALVAVIFGGIWLIATMLSDPA
jgi:hypothetical protein